MKIKQIIPMGLVFALASTGVMFALNAMEPVNAPANTGTSQGKTVNGSVTQIDTANNTVQVKDNTGSVQTVVLNQGAVVTRASGEGTNINDLKIGDVVSIKIAPSRTPGS